ncbi:hypothetical protein UlMin_027142 [Ulmus minor]
MVARLRRNTRVESSHGRGWKPPPKRTYEVAFAQGAKGKGTFRKDPPEFPYKVEKVIALMEAWIQDESLELPELGRVLTPEEKQHLKGQPHHATTRSSNFKKTRKMQRTRKVSEQGDIVTPSEEPREQANALEEVNLSDNPKELRTVLISKELTGSIWTDVVDTLRSNRDVFIWNYDEMPGLDPILVTHKLGVEPAKRLKNGTIRCCIDNRDLNRACPKDDFPLPNIDMLVDAIAGHKMFSFMDGFSGYNQIRMAPEDAEKTTFRTPFGNFHYVVMPFGLNNAGATYQRAMTAIFHDMVHDIVEDYVDDLVVKSRRAEDHVAHLKRVFDRCRKYKLKMNPKKCAFAVSMGKF